MKTNLSQSVIYAMLSDEMGEIDDLRPMIEGEESQAYSFLFKEKYYVVRINPKIEGFKKDQYAYENYSSDKIPMPRVVRLGYIDDNHAFCVSELVGGITLQDANPKQIANLLEPLTNVWAEIGVTDVSNTHGYGEYDGYGNGKYETWQNFILGVLRYDWGKVADLVDTELVEKAKNELETLSSNMPNLRKLVHGDFGANNMLVENGQIKSVIDWENSLYGDPLYDISIAYFWSSWLICVEMSAKYWEDLLSKTEDYHRRIKCYQLRIALHEIYDNATDNDSEMVSWLQKRTKEILD